MVEDHTENVFTNAQILEKSESKVASDP